MSGTPSRAAPGTRAGRVAPAALAAAALAASITLIALGWQPPIAPPADPQIGAPPPERAERAPRATAAFAPAPEQGDLPHTQLPLRLVATVLRENRKLSLATLEDTDHGGHQVMNEGQPFRNHPAATLASVERGRVLIDNAGVREQLLIDRSVAAGPLALAPEELERRRALTDAGEDFRALHPMQTTGLLAEGEVSPVYEDGELIGIQIEAIREGGVYDQVGLRDGDVVTAVNGVPLGEPTAAAEVLAELALSDLLEVAVERTDGTQELLSVPTAEFTEAVQEIE